MRKNARNSTFPGTNAFFSDMVKFAVQVLGISNNSIGWIVSVWAKKANAGRFERGYLKVTTENLTSWSLSRREKPPKTNF